MFADVRDIGKDLLEKPYFIIRNKLKKYGIASQLRYRLRYYFNDKTDAINIDQTNEIIKRVRNLFVGAKDS